VNTARGASHRRESACQHGGGGEGRGEASTFRAHPGDQPMLLKDPRSCLPLLRSATMEGRLDMGEKVIITFVPSWTGKSDRSSACRYVVKTATQGRRAASSKKCFFGRNIRLLTTHTFLSLPPQLPSPLYPPLLPPLPHPTATYLLSSPIIPSPQHLTPLTDKLLNSHPDDLLPPPPPVPFLIPHLPLCFTPPNSFLSFLFLSLLPLFTTFSGCPPKRQKNAAPSSIGAPPRPQGGNALGPIRPE